MRHEIYRCIKCFMLWKFGSAFIDRDEILLFHRCECNGKLKLVKAHDEEAA